MDWFAYFGTHVIDFVFNYYALQFFDFYLLCRSEYWVANARYYCEHCKIHILDNKAVCYLSQKNFSCMIEGVILRHLLIH